jgi:hypothetical protein
MQLVGGFEAAGLLELGDGFRRLLEAEGKLGRNGVVSGVACGRFLEVVEGLRG